MPARALKTVSACALIALALVACERKKAAAPPLAAPRAAAPVLSGPEGFQHDPAFDAQGFFIPTTPVRVANLKLRHIAFGAPSDFKQWEAGARDAVFGPILLYFEDETSPTNANDLGETLRVLPTGYRVAPGAVGFRATDPKVGDIVFTGAIDVSALKASREAGPGDSRVAMTGTLRIGGATFAGVQFTYFMGD